uniref:Integrase catalytic domain-containing protein n=1 Tax=Chenopodium quinoa TaxID=63459 RepID=A0A803MAM0_CHEQI
MQVAGRGVIAIKTVQGDVKLLYDVQFVPNLAHNLLSIGQLMSSGYKIVFDDGVCDVIDKKSGHNIANVHMTQNRMFPLDISNDIISNVLIAKLTNESELWHLRYGHLNGRSLKLLNQKEIVVGLPKIGELSFCEGCVYGKHSKASFPTGKAWRASKCLELVHANLCGPMNTESLGGSIGGKPKWQTHSFCDEHGIRRDLTAPYTPEQNGVAERKNRTVVEMARSMLKAKGISNKFWGEAVSTAVCLLNISPTKAVYNRTPFEAWRGKKPGVSHLRIFGCVSYALVNNRSKLDDKFDKCIFIGYCSQSKAYRLYNPVSGKVIISRNVVFNEEARFKWNVDKDGIADYVPVDGEADEQPAANSTTSSPASTPPSTPSSSTSESPSSSGSSDSRDTPVRRSRSLAELYSSWRGRLGVEERECGGKGEEKDLGIESPTCETWASTATVEGRGMAGAVREAVVKGEGVLGKRKGWLP